MSGGPVKPVFINSVELDSFYISEGNYYAEISAYVVHFLYETY